MIVAANFCSQCGYENGPQRAVCLMCYTPLNQAGDQTQCPQCGADNPAQASFCQGCGVALVEGVEAAPGMAVGAALVVEALSQGLVGPRPEPESAMVEVGEVEMAAEEVAALAEEPGEPALATEVGEVGDVIEPAEMEEEFIPPPPGAIEPEEMAPAEAEAMEAPAPPPGAVELEEEQIAPPPPPGAIELEEAEAPAEEEFAPPPPPPDAVSLTEETEAEAGESEELDEWGLTSTE